ncbi:hypothetical protein MOUN0_G01772 [Monosporozyma unispora]
MQRSTPPPDLQQQCKRQTSYGVGEMGQEMARISDPLNSKYINTNSSNPHYMSNELATVGMRIRQRVDQGYTLLNREKSDLNNASLNIDDNIKNYAGLIVPQFNPTSPPLSNNSTFENTSIANSTITTTLDNSTTTTTNNNTDQDIQMCNEQEEEEEEEEEVIYSNGKRRY